MDAPANLLAPTVPAVEPRAPARKRRRVRLERLLVPLRWAASWVPFTEEFTRHARDAVRDRMAVFGKLDCIPRAERQKLRTRLEDAEEVIERMHLRMRAAVAGIIGFSAWSLGYCVLFFIPSRFNHVEPLLMPGAVLDRFGILLYAPLVATLAVTVDAGVRGRRGLAKRFGTGAARVVVGLALVPVALWLAYAMLLAWSSALNPVLYLSALWISTFTAVALTALLLRQAVHRTMEFYRERGYAAWPEAAVVHELLSILLRLEETRRRDRWLDLCVRHELVQRLERAAACIDRCLPRRLMHADAGTHVWLTRETRAIAGSLRELKRSLCLPRPGVIDEFRHAVGDTLVSLAGGDWSRMERRLEEEEEAAAAPAPKPLTRVQLVARALAVVAAAGVVAFLVGRSSEKVLETFNAVLSDVYGLVIPLVAPIVAFTVLKAINPSYTSDLPAIRQLGKKE